MLHEYVLMPDHFHILITPSVSLERALQFIKGGFSYRVKKELESPMEIWQTGFSDHRIRDAEDYHIHVEYIYRNPVGRKLVERAIEYPYCSAFPGSEKDDPPQRLKPFRGEKADGAPEGAPLQNLECAPLQNPKPAPLRSTGSLEAPKHASLPDKELITT